MEQSVVNTLLEVEKDILNAVAKADSAVTPADARSANALYTAALHRARTLGYRASLYLFGGKRHVQFHRLPGEKRMPVVIPTTELEKARAVATAN